MDEFNEEEVSSFVKRVLSQADGSHPFSANYLGLAETDLLAALHERLSKRFIESEVNDIFQEARTDIVSRKVSLTLTELHTVTRNCKKCSIQAPAELPKWNVTDPDIAVVIESPSLPADAINVMIEAFKTAGIQSSQLCLTYLNRCPVQRKYEDQEITNCAPYLHSELQLLNPKLIVCLGNLPVSILFGVLLKMKDIHGQVRWLGYWPILSTYSPMYVARALQAGQPTVVQQFQQDITNAKNFITKRATS